MVSKRSHWFWSLNCLHRRGYYGVGKLSTELSKLSALCPLCIIYLSLMAFSSRIKLLLLRKSKSMLTIVLLIRKYGLIDTICHLSCVQIWGWFVDWLYLVDWSFSCFLLLLALLVERMHTHPLLAWHGSQSIDTVANNLLLGVVSRLRSCSTSVLEHVRVEDVST